MSNQFTPGPWDGRNDGLVSTRNGNVRFILRIERHGSASTLDDEDRACMDLVLAAPALYESLKLARGYVADRASGGRMVRTALNAQEDMEIINEALALVATPETQ